MIGPLVFFNNEQKVYPNTKCATFKYFKKN